VDSVAERFHLGLSLYPTLSSGASLTPKSWKGKRPSGLIATDAPLLRLNEVEDELVIGSGDCLYKTRLHKDQKDWI
jgi:hypothetical protein